MWRLLGDTADGSVEDQTDVVFQWGIRRLSWEIIYYNVDRPRFLSVRPCKDVGRTRTTCFRFVDGHYYHCSLSSRDLISAFPRHDHVGDG